MYRPHNMDSGKSKFAKKEEAFVPFTHQQSERISNALERNLGPEFVSIRPGPGANKLSYLEGWKAIQLANQIFGFNGWSTEVKAVQVDYVDEHAGKYSVGLSVIVRVVLKDGSFHEDIGYGNIENCRTKAAAFDKCKKEATTDAMKRALRQFGNALGNCLYDKNYLNQVSKITKNKDEFDSESLIRGPGSFMGNNSAQNNLPAQPQEPHYRQHLRAGATSQEAKQPGRFLHPTNQSLVTPSKSPVNATGTPIERPNGVVKTEENASKGFHDNYEEDDSFAFSDDIIPEDLPDSEPEMDSKIDDYEMQLIMDKHESQIDDNASVNNGKAAADNANSTTNTTTSTTANNTTTTTAPANVSTSASSQLSDPPPAIWVSARLADDLNNNTPLREDQRYNPNFQSPTMRKSTNIDHSKSAPIKRSITNQLQGSSQSNDKENNHTYENPKLAPKRTLGMPPSKLQNKRHQR